MIVISSEQIKQVEAEISGHEQKQQTTKYIHVKEDEFLDVCKELQIPIRRHLEGEHVLINSWRPCVRMRVNAMTIGYRQSEKFPNNLHVVCTLKNIKDEYTKKIGISRVNDWFEKLYADAKKEDLNSYLTENAGSKQLLRDERDGSVIIGASLSASQLCPGLDMAVMPETLEKIRAIDLYNSVIINGIKNQVFSVLQILSDWDA